MTCRRRLPAPVLLLTLLLVGCTSQVPLLIRQGPADSPAPRVVSTRSGDYAGRTVRWGGRLIATENRTDVTRLTILARPLAGDGEPAAGDASLGRFIAVVPQFLDPKVYVPERRVTVTGTLRGSETARVGDHPYRYPVVEAQAWYLWPDPAAPYDSAYPWWYDPWYGPWWYGIGYDPWYYPSYHPRWSHRHHHPHRRAPDTGPALPKPRHRRPVPHDRPARDSTPPPGHAAPHPRGERPRERPRPGPRGPRVRSPSGTRSGPEQAPVPAPEERAAPPPPAPAPAFTPGPGRVLPGFFRRRRGD